jgi:hypothetical protein
MVTRAILVCVPPLMAAVIRDHRCPGGDLVRRREARLVCHLGEDAVAAVGIVQVGVRLKWTKNSVLPLSGKSAWTHSTDLDCQILRWFSRFLTCSSYDTECVPVTLYFETPSHVDHLTISAIWPSGCSWGPRHHPMVKWCHMEQKAEELCPLSLFRSSRLSRKTRGKHRIRGCTAGAWTRS